jgi:hypothetical protein
MRLAAVFLLVALAACNETVGHLPPPMDRFFYPGGLALTPVAGGNQALLVASANYDLHYDRNTGSTLLSIDPRIYDPAAGTGGSVGRTGGALVKFGEGARLGSFAGPVAVANAEVTCPSLTGGPQAFVVSRYTRTLYRFPIGPDGSVESCSGPTCELGLSGELLDPAPLGIACRADGLRRSLFVSYMRGPQIGPVAAGTAWLTEFDLGDLIAPSRTFHLAAGPVGDMAYDALTDRLYAVGRFAGLTAPLFILDLPPCSSRDPATCPTPRLKTVELFGSLGGAELVGIALSNPRLDPSNPSRYLPRTAYIAARVYDEGYALAIRSRPNFDVGGALMVVDLYEDVLGQPTARVRSVVPIGLGAGSVRVLPPRPGLADLVVVTSTGDGSVQVYDDEVGALVRVISIDQFTGAPEAGHAPFQTAVEDRGSEGLVYIASFRDWTVGVLRVPLADPTSADLLRHPAGTPLQGTPMRIGSPKP